MRRLLPVLALLLAVAPLAQPAVDPADLVRAMEDAVTRLDYDAAEARAREALARFDALSPDQLVTVHTTLGVILYGRNETVEARRQFEAALSIDPALALDPVLVSPKTVEFFDAIRAEQTTVGPGAGPEIRYVVLADPRPTAALRSLVAPGWGQFTKGDRARGWAFATGAGVAVLGVAATHAARADARADYLAAATSAEADRLYPAYDRWHRARTAFALGAAAVWAASALDALATGGPQAPEAVSLSPALEIGGVRLRARF